MTESKHAREAAEKAGNALRREGLIYQTVGGESDRVEEILEAIIQSAIEKDREELVSELADNHQKHIENLECSLLDANKKVEELEEGIKDLTEALNDIGDCCNDSNKWLVIERKRIAELKEKLNHYIEQQETFSHSLGETITDIKAKDKRIAELEKQIRDSDEAFKSVMEENCAGDEIHCTCVPFLRERITELEKALVSELGYSTALKLAMTDIIRRFTDPDFLAALESDKDYKLGLKAVVGAIASELRGLRPADPAIGEEEK